MEDLDLPEWLSIQAASIAIFGHPDGGCAAVAEELESADPESGSSSGTEGDGGVSERGVTPLEEVQLRSWDRSCSGRNWIIQETSCANFVHSTVAEEPESADSESCNPLGTEGDGGVSKGLVTPFEVVQALPLDF
jgi:hypothetical protein